MAAFAPFCRLPTELRFEIWSHLLPDKILYAADIHPDGHRMYLVGVGLSPTFVMQSCREARALGEKKYSRVPFMIDPRNNGFTTDLWFTPSTLVFLGPAKTAKEVLARFIRPQPALKYLALEKPRHACGQPHVVSYAATFHGGITDLVMHFSAWKRCPQPWDFRNGRDDRLAEALGWYLDACLSGKDDIDSDDPIFSISRENIREHWTVRRKKAPRIHLLTERDGWPTSQPSPPAIPCDVVEVPARGFQPREHADAWPAAQWNSVFPPDSE